MKQGLTMFYSYRLLPLFLACLNGFRIRSPLVVQKRFGEIVELIAPSRFAK